KEYIAQKEWIFPPEPHLRLIGDLMEHCARTIRRPAGGPAPRPDAGRRGPPRGGPSVPRRPRVPRTLRVQRRRQPGTATQQLRPPGVQPDQLAVEEHQLLGG
ncbi:hypothetical protein, partial [Streptomyces diastaticus]|uniref:hypothetical protein n=1 Tax=Streptomyces diastaticus TaxID=1956 RepID=UPI0036598A56